MPYARIDMDLVVVPTGSDQSVVVSVAVWGFRARKTRESDFEGASPRRREMRILFCKQVSSR